MGRLVRLLSEVPHCPVCDGPCTHDFERSEYRMPDRLPQANEEPEPAKKHKKRRGRRPTEDTARKPEADRMRRPSEDR